LIYEKDPSGNETHYKRTLAGLPYHIEQVGHSQNFSKYTIDNLVERSTSPNGDTTYYFYDVLGRETKTERIGAQGEFLVLLIHPIIASI